MHAWSAVNKAHAESPEISYDIDFQEIADGGNNHVATDDLPETFDCSHF